MKTLEKQNIGKDILCKWQTKVDLLEELMKVSAVLIMKLHPHELEVFIGSKNEENPFEVGDRGELNIGAYCDSVVASKSKVKIEDASINDYWKNKIKNNSGMSSYIGLPLFYPNEELFGTLCVLNQQCRVFDQLDQQLIEHLRKSIESDLLISH